MYTGDVVYHMSQETVYDPRTEVSHPVEEGQVYEDSRNDDELVLVYVSDDVVLLRDTGDPTSENWSGHRLERREQFDKYVGAGRYDLTQSETGEYTNRGKLRKLRKLEEQYKQKDGRKAKHKANVLEEAVELLENDGRPDDNEVVDFEDVNGIGERTAENLVNDGFRVKRDIREAEDADLLDVSGIGEGNLQNLREYIEQ